MCNLLLATLKEKYEDGIPVLFSVLGMTTFDCILPYFEKKIGKRSFSSITKINSSLHSSHSFQLSILPDEYYRLHRIVKILQFMSVIDDLSFCRFRNVGPKEE